MTSTFIGFGIVLFIVALLLWLGAIGLLRYATSSRDRRTVITPGMELDQKGESPDALFVIQTGGRISSANRTAASLFGLKEGEPPSLESIARRLRPSEQFLNLCAAEGQARFVFEGRLLDAVSFHVMNGDQPVMIVSLRSASAQENVGGEGSSLGVATLKNFTELTQSMAASLDLEDTIEAILANIEKIIPAELMEVAIWNTEAETLTPYRKVGQAGTERALILGSERYHPGSGFHGVIAQMRTPLMINDLEARPDLTLDLDRDAFPVRSFLGVPLVASTEFIGTLGLASTNRGAFQQNDLDLVSLLSGQAAIAVHNALLYRAEQQRANELTSLANLTQAFTVVRDPRSLFTRLVENIAPLISVEILGFLIYNENLRSLEGQVPFNGLPSQFIEIYHIPIPPGSPAEQTLLDQDIILSENASEDPQFERLGLERLAQAASLKDTALIPLTSSGRTLGYLQASNHTNGLNTFDRDEIHLLTIVANQAATIIDNSNLVQQSRLRAQRAESLRKIGALASSAATLDEILKYSVQELAQLLQADMAVVFLVNRDHGDLVLHRPSFVGAQNEITERLLRLPMEDPQYPFTVSGGLHSLNYGQVKEEKTIIPFYRQLFARWNAESAVAVPLIVRDEGIGELWIGSLRPEFFNQGDLQVLSTAAGQLAGVVEQSTLTAQTDESLRRRVQQMTSITRISRELSTSLDLKYLLQLVYDEAVRATRASCGSIVMFDPHSTSERNPGIRLFVGDEPESALSELELEVREYRKPVIVADFSSYPNPAPHADVQSALVVPVEYQGQCAGLISLHSHNIHGFDDSALEITQSLAFQAAVALGNALQYEDQLKRSELLKRELETLSNLFRVTQNLRAEKPLEETMQAIGAAICEATPFQMVVISVYEQETSSLRRLLGLGLSPETWVEMSAHQPSWDAVEQLIAPEFRIGNVYYIPINKRPAVPDEIHLLIVLPDMAEPSPDQWNPEDMLFVPLFDADQKPLGLISVDGPRDGLRPDRPTLEALELFAVQAIQVIENHNRLSALKNHTYQLESDRLRLETAAQDATRNLPALLRRQMEQSIAIQALYRQMGRVKSGLTMAEAAAQQTDPNEVLAEMGRSLLRYFDFQTALIAENTPGGPKLLDVFGAIPTAVNPEALFGQRNPLRQLLQDGEMLLVANLETEKSWQRCALLTGLDAKSFVAMPVMIGEKQYAGILAIGQKPLPPFTEEDRQTYLQICRQVGVSLQNLRLLNETRRRLREVNLLLDFSRKLGMLESDGILDTLLASAMEVIPEAQAGWVGIWNLQKGALQIRAARGIPDVDSLKAIEFLADPQRSESYITPLPLRTWRTAIAQRVDEINFPEDYNLPSDDLLRYRKATEGRLPLSSLAVPLSLAGTVLGVMVLDSYGTSAAFTPEDEALAGSLAQQSALAMESARLFSAVQQRASQLHALTQVAGAITSSLKREDLIASLPDLLRSVLPYETATLWLRSEETLTVAAATGFSDEQSRTGLSVEVGESALFQEMIRTGQPILVHDVRQDARFSTLVEPENLCWLGIPLIVKSELIGVIALEKKEAGFYTPDYVQAGTTFASQAAVALDNARLFEESVSRAGELELRSQRLGLLNRLSSELGASLDVDLILRLTCKQLVGALGGSRAAAVLIDDQNRYILSGEAPAMTGGMPILLPHIPLFDRLRESNGVFISSDVDAEAELAPLVSVYLRSRKSKSLLVIPLISGQKLHGWLLLQMVRSYRFGVSEIELARTIGNQASIAIQNARLFAQTRSLTEDLERRVQERTAELSREHNNTQTLLRIITELSASLEMGLVMNRTMSVLNESTGCEQSLIILADKRTIYQAGELLAVPALGMALEKEIAAGVMLTRSPVISTDLGLDDRWKVTDENRPLYRSLMAIPLLLGEQVLGAMLLLHRAPGFFRSEQINLLQAAARQISIALNNAELFVLIRDQAENLGSMLRDQQIEASRSRAILEAVADGVLVTNAENNITLFNASAARILELRSAQVLGQSLDQFAGIFGKAARTWMQTIRMWTQNPASYQSVEVYSEQLSLDNGRVVSIHLAPVIWRNDFLGTVSIFRDITAEVEVDRLKSEFVANVSHELRTPMTSIKGYVDIMLMGAAGAVTDQQKHFLTVVKENTQRLSILVNDLLDISRIESGRVTINLTELNMADVARDVIADLKRRSHEEDRPMNFALEALAELPPAAGDPERIRQVLGALVSNGYNYTPDNGNVTVAIHVTDTDLQVDVKDNGIGIAPSEQHRVFERFYRGDDPLVLASAGTGLGLVIAKTLIEMHHGRIWFHSSGVRGEGSVFSFTLPIYQGED